MPLGHVARPDESAFERALEISILGEGAPALRGWTLDGSGKAEKFVLRSWTNPNPAHVLFDFLAAVEPPSASVQVLRPNGPEPCPYGTGKVSNGDLAGHPTFPRRRFNCPGSEWSFVGFGPSSRIKTTDRASASGPIRRTAAPWRSISRTCRSAPRSRVMAVCRIWSSASRTARRSSSPFGSGGKRSVSGRTPTEKAGRLRVFYDCVRGQRASVDFQVRSREVRARVLLSGECSMNRGPVARKAAGAGPFRRSVDLR